LGSQRHLVAGKLHDRHAPRQDAGRLFTKPGCAEACKKINSTFKLTGNYGAHTLRKTFGYIQRVHYGVGFEIICKRYNHSSPSITMRYLGIEDREVHNILMNEIG